MEATQFDHVAKAVGQGTARRRLLAGLLGAILSKGPDVLADGGDHGSSHRRQRRKARHDPGGDKDNRKGKRKGKAPGSGETCTGLFGFCDFVDCCPDKGLHCAPTFYGNFCMKPCTSVEDCYKLDDLRDQRLWFCEKNILECPSLDKCCVSPLCAPLLPTCPAGYECSRAVCVKQ